MTDDYDSPWKDVLERYFPEFMAFFFAEAHADINWSKGYESLDTELQQIVRDAESGKRLADKLMKVWRRDGKAQIVLIHVEVQGEPDADFARRMYIYNYRLYDRYQRPIVSLAVLGDDDLKWRPNHYHLALWNCETGIRFPIVKLAEYNDRWPQLDQGDNPFATMVMAHLKTKATRHDLQARLSWKLILVKRLYEKGYRREDVLELFRFIDWLLYLPDELEQRFADQLSEYEATMSTPYITSIERRGIEKGILQGEARGLQRGLRAERALLRRLATRRFDDAVAESLSRLLDNIDDPDRLADIGEWVLDEQTGEALLTRVRQLIADKPDKGG